jgi:hypothetical protein
MSRAAAVLLLPLVWLAWLPGFAQAAYTRDAELYRVELGSDPATPVDAMSGLADRKTAIVRAAACQDEITYWGASWSGDPHDRGEGSSATVIGKEGVLLRQTAAWFSGANPVICSETVKGTLGELKLPSGKALASDILGAVGPDIDQQVGFVNENIARVQPMILSALQAQFDSVFGTDCAGGVKDVVLDQADANLIKRAIDANFDTRPDLVKMAITYELPLRCLKAQLNVTLKNMVVLGRVGSSDLPCPFDGSGTGEGVEDPNRDAFKVHGEWDVDMRDLIRILYLNEESANARAARVPWLIDQPVVDHIRRDLFPLNTFVGQDTYSPLQCGAQEDGHGDALERLSERDWTDKALSSIGDLLKWLFHRALLIILVAAGAAVALAVFPYLAPAIVPVAVAIAVAGGLGQIPETENHRLMIETTRFLHNQLLLRELARDHPDADVSNLKDDQDDVKAWLMKRLRKIYREDFDEYNSRPYQRYSIMAILNLSAFSGDPDLATAANMVLTTIGAKAALASNMSVRYVPFRRRPSSANAQFLCSAGGEPHPCPSVTDLTGGADHWIGLLEVYSGQTPQRMGKMSISAAKEMSYAATSAYALPETVVALAIPDAQTQPRWQIRRHEVPEVTYSERAFLVTAGGKDAGPANHFEMGVLGLSVPTPAGARSDEGTAAPTTLQFRPRARTAADPAPPSPSPDNTILANLIRIYGRFDSDKDHDWTVEPAPLQAGDASPEFTENLCVYRSFACGRNLAIPPDFIPCLTSEPTLPGLSYLDTDACPAIKNVAPTYVAVWRAPCDGDADTDDCYNMGFFEAISADGLGFDAFQARVRGRNAAKSGRGFACRDTYTTARSTGQAIEYRCDDDHAIRSVDGTTVKDYTDEDRAKGNVMVRTGDGYVHTIWWPESAGAITLDWSDPNHPVHP